MKLAVLGTGPVATALAVGWTAAGHDVTLGSRSPQGKQNLPCPVVDLAEAVRSAGVVVNATPGASSVATLSAVGRATFAGKLLIDVGNAYTRPFDLGYPTSSLAEALQEALPDTRVVKTLNTVNAAVMGNPAVLPETDVFVSGDDERAKEVVVGLVQDLGWPAEAVIDLGGLATARAVEHYLMLFAACAEKFGTSVLNLRIVR